MEPIAIAANVMAKGRTFANAWEGDKFLICLACLEFDACAFLSSRKEENKLI
jgi:hypothetical protein